MGFEYEVRSLRDSGTGGFRMTVIKMPNKSRRTVGELWRDSLRSIKSNRASMTGSLPKDSVMERAQGSQGTKDIRVICMDDDACFSDCVYRYR